MRDVLRGTDREILRYKNEAGGELIAQAVDVAVPARLAGAANGHGVEDEAEG